jgi:peptidoglycan/LPS O-acetylase OafA/YrhL
MDPGCVGRAPAEGGRTKAGLEAAQTASNDLKRGVPAGRNSALDFTKGVLVLLMVLYHWINYFVSRDGGFYKYLRFITPSFIFITGFLIANVYLARFQIGDPRLHLRLVQRGIKLLVIFTLLNIGGSLLLAPGAGEGTAGFAAFLQSAGSTYITGNGRTASFSVLVPISYVLIFSSVLLFPCKWFKPFLTVVCGLLWLGIYVLHRNNLGSANLELFTIGLLGMVLGRLPIERIDRLADQLWLIVAAYGGYLTSLAVWNEIYPLQVVGVCLSVLLIYIIGIRIGDWSVVHRPMMLLGKYTLLAYIAQIAVLVLLSILLRRLNLGDGSRLAVSFLGALGLTIAIIKAVDHSREQWIPVDRLYKFVFA